MNNLCCLMLSEHFILVINVINCTECLAVEGTLTNGYICRGNNMVNWYYILQIFSLKIAGFQSILLYTCNEWPRMAYVSFRRVDALFVLWITFLVYRIYVNWGTRKHLWSHYSSLITYNWIYRILYVGDKWRQIT